VKYLGLYALGKLLPIRPRAVTEHRDVILECLEDKDISIRMRALEIVTGMVGYININCFARAYEHIFWIP
jgi:AP-3 complex subunit delta-1